MNRPDPRALYAEAQALERAGRVEAAIAAYRRLLAAWPGLADCWYNLGLLERRARRPEAALAAYAEALRQGVAGAEEVFLNRAVVYADDLRDPAAAERELEQALARNPHYLPALLNLGNLHEDLGRREAALAAYARVLALEPGHVEALARRAGLARPAGRADAAIRELEAALARPGLAPAAQATLGFALGRALDACGAYAEAFRACAAANAASRAAAPTAPRYDRAAQAALVDELIATFTAERVAALATGLSAAPVFICGMFRSGSTLAEQVLGAHPRVVAGGELELLPALAHGALAPFPQRMAGVTRAELERHAAAYLARLAAIGRDGRLVTDKRPDNFLLVGLIKSLFPRARIVHTVRAPLDNVLSVYFLHLDPSVAYATDLGDIEHYRAEQARLMAHWHALFGADVLEFDYDAFVREPRPQAGRLLAHCGLDWDERCLEFHRAPTAVRTASVWQVREPLYQRASGRWRHYAAELRAAGLAVPGE